MITSIITNSLTSFLKSDKSNSGSYGLCSVIYYIYTVQLRSKLTLACGEHMCVLQFLSRLESKHACDTKWAARKSTFVYCTRAIFHALHVSNTLCSKKHMSNALTCAAYASVSCVLHAS